MSDIVERSKRHLRQLSPHVAERESAVLLTKCLDEIEKLRRAVEILQREATREEGLT